VVGLTWDEDFILEEYTVHHATHKLLHYSRDDALSMTKQSCSKILNPQNTHIVFSNLKSL
jgi:hypothetical protein